MTRESAPCVLALYPTRRGFCFAFFEGPARPIDWSTSKSPGTHRVRNQHVLERIEALLEKYHPDTIVIEDHEEPGVRRAERIQRLYRGILHAAQVCDIDVYRITRKTVHSAFSLAGAVTKYEIAEAVAREFPAIAYSLPKKRRLWDPEHPMMWVFTAAALALAYYSAHPANGGNQAVAGGIEQLGARHRNI